MQACGEVEGQFHALTSALDGRLQASAALFPRDERRYPLGRRLGGPRADLDLPAKRKSCLTGNPGHPDDGGSK